MSSLTSVGLRKRVSELWFLWLGEASTISDILQSFYIKGIGVDEHHFLKNWSHLDLKLKKYAEVAENSLGLIKTFSITKIWPIQKHQICIKISALPLCDLSLKNVAYLHDTLRVLFQKNAFSVIINEYKK